MYGRDGWRGEISRIAGELGVGDSVEKLALDVCERLKKAKMTYGVKSDKMAKICVYIAARKLGVAVDVGVLLDFPHPFRLLRAMYEALGESMEAEVPVESYVRLAVERLRLPPEVAEVAGGVLAELLKFDHVRARAWSRRVIAVAVTYEAARRLGVKVTKRQICRVLGVTEAAVRGFTRQLRMMGVPALQPARKRTQPPSSASSSPAPWGFRG